MTSWAPLPSYRFHATWRVDAPQDRTFAVLADLEAYPQWWPQVRQVRSLDEDRADVVCRSALPYSLRLRMTRRVEDPESGVLEAAVDGDLVGWVRWTLDGDDATTRVVFDQEVQTPGRLLLVAGRVARWLLEANHALMMRSCRRRLAARAQR